jgi:photosystem II stability/assembly factor-like uncharacterized protein
MLRHLRLVTLCAILLALALSGSSVIGQAQATIPVATEFDSLHFRSIGPATMSGRISDLAVYEANPAIYYVGAAHGGVWKTTSNGAMFEPQFQNMGLMSIGDVTVSQRDPNLVWIGTGESNNRQSSPWGDGVYKSTDGGRTWRNMGLRESRHVNRILIDPVDNNIVFVAATGPLWGSGGDRGVYKTTDGGANWKLVLKGDANTGANDLVQAFTDRNILYASTYTRQRSQCCFNGGGPDSGIWKSTDHGETWTRLTATLPQGQLGRIALDVYRNSANLVYALIEAEPLSGPAAPDGRGGDPGAAGQRGGGGGGGGGRGGGGGGTSQSGLYRSDDGGATWRRVNATNPRPMYFSQVRIDPKNPDRVYMGGVGLHMTNDGGQSMATDAALVIHDDIHAIWINPNNTDHLLIGGDGGVSVSYDTSRTWIQMPNLPLALYYHVSVDNEIPYNICGGLQDNYNWCGPSATRFARGIKNTDWYQVQGGDGFVVLTDPRDARYVYSESQDGNIQKKNRITGEARNIRPNFLNVSPAPGEGALPFRWNWDTPMILSPNDQTALIVAANRVFKSNDRGDSWTAISPDLTTNADRNELTIMGVRNTEIRLSRNDGISAYATIVSLAESPKLPGFYFTGSDDGVVAMSKDAGKTWDTKVAARLPEFPAGGYVSEVVPSRYDAATVYITVDAHRHNDYNTYIWASNDSGATFRSISANLRGEVVRTLLEDPKNADVLYVGTETGLFLTVDRGKSWRRLKANLPTVRIDEMVIHPRDNALILGTHGRALWVLDHLEPIQEYAAVQAAATADAKLFSVPTGVQFRMFDNQNEEFWGHQFFLGENPPADAVIQFHLKKPVTDLRLKITDAAGRELRDLAVPANRNQAGIQTVCWDMRLQPIPAAAGAAAAGAGRGGGGGGAQGRGGGAGGPGGGLTGIPTPLPESGVDPVNPCGGGGGGFGGFGGGGGATAGPLVYSGTYTVSLSVGGKVVDSKPMKVMADPAVQMNDLQAKRYYDIVSDLHELHRRGAEMTAALNPLYTQMTEVGGKIKGMSDVPDAVKAQFDAVNKEFDAVRVKFGVPPPPPPQGGGGRGGGGGFGGGAPANPADLVARTGAVKAQIMSFQDTPSEALVKQYNDVKVALPKAILDANAVLVKAMTLSQTLKKSNVTLTVPGPVK